MRSQVSTLVILLVIALSISMARAAESTGQRRALLIGINEYANPEIPDLRGALNDIGLIRTILIRRFGFDKASIRLLTDTEADRVGILQALDRLVDEVQPGDFVYLHYSGHGSQVEDLSGDEADGLDETLVPHDGRQEGVPDITDDELYQRLSRLRAAGALLVFDSCHSGTISRSISEVRTRFVPQDVRLGLYSGTRTRDIRSVSEGVPYTVMSGAPADREALDGPVGGVFYGLFSYSLAQSLDRSRHDATPPELLTDIREQLLRIESELNVRPPEPQLEASSANLGLPWLPLPSERESARRSWVEVRNVAGDLVMEGAADGHLVLGSHWAIFEPGEKQFKFGDALATGRLEEVRGNLAVLSVEGSARIPDQSRAIQLLSGTGQAATTARIESSVPPADAVVLRSELMALLPDLVFVGQDEPARFVISGNGRNWKIGDAGGLVTLLMLEDVALPQAAGEISRLMRSRSRAAALLALDNPVSGMELTVRTAFSEVPGIMTMRGAGEPRTASNSLMIEIRSSHDAYLTIASVDTEGGVNLLFPNDYQRPGFLPDGWVEAHAWVRVPDSLEPGNRAGFYWDYGPPAGTDTIKVFAAASAETADVIRRFIRDSRANVGRLADLGGVLEVGVTRGVRVVADEPEPRPKTEMPARGDWTSRSIVLSIQEP